MSIEDLGRRATACKHWRWMGGMAAIDRPLWRIVERAGLPPYMVNGYMEESLDGVLPDLSDPATMGCLLYLVREAWPDEWHEFMVPIFDGWSHWRVGCLQLERLPGAPRAIVPVNQETMKPLVWAYAEAEALVVALEAAP